MYASISSSGHDSSRMKNCRSPPGEPALYGNQIALRIAGLDALTNSCFAKCLKALLSGSDLHTDVNDGHRIAGTPAFYAAFPEEGRPAPAGDHPFPYSDVAVLPMAAGGRGGFRVQTMHPEYLTILLMNTPTTLHGSVFPDDLHRAAEQMPTGLLCVRAIHYPLHWIDCMLHKLRDHPEGIANLLSALDRQGAQSARVAVRLREQLGL